MYIARFLPIVGLFLSQRFQNSFAMLIITAAAFTLKSKDNLNFYFVKSNKKSSNLIAFDFKSNRPTN